MNIWSVTEFKEYFSTPSRFELVYDTANNPGGETGDVKLIQRYTRVVCMLNPNRIMFANDSGSFCINRVKFIRHYEDECAPGGMFSVIYGDKNNNEHDASCTFIADVRRRRLRDSE